MNPLAKDATAQSKQMTRRRFYAPPAAFASDRKSVTLSSEETRHARSVLRLRPDDEVYVFDGSGHEFKCTVEAIAKDSTKLRVLAEVKVTRPESPLNLTLAIALLKGEKFDFVVQKTTELGANVIVPLETERAEPRLRNPDDSHKHVARWQRIAREAAKQSGRASVPEIREPVRLGPLLKMSAIGDQTAPVTRLIFTERGGNSFAEAVQTLPVRPLRIIAIIGPEGGWSDQEIELARESGWHTVSLGGRTLRAETAAIAIVSLLQHRFGDLV